MAPYRYIVRRFWTDSDDEEGGVTLTANMNDMNDLTRSLPAVPGQSNANLSEGDVLNHPGNEEFGNDVRMEELNGLSELHEQLAAAGAAIADAPNISMIDTSAEEPDVCSQLTDAHSLLHGEANDADDVLIARATNDAVMDTAEDLVSPDSPMSDASTAVSGGDQEARVRQDMYANIYSGRFIPLSELREPQDCLQLPDLKHEIIEAYLRWTTITVPIWSNFDAADYQFFTDRRADDCGKLQLAKHSRQRLESLDQKIYKMRKVRLLISTPFRTLVEINIDIPDTNEVASITGVVPFHFGGNPKFLHPYVVKRMKLIRKLLREGQCPDGFTLSDLDELATLFRRYPTSEDRDTRFWHEGQNWDLWREEEVVQQEQEEDVPDILTSPGQGIIRIRGG